VGAKNISISLDLEPEVIGLLFEPSLIEQVLVNLLDNASKFTPRGGEIAIKGYTCFWDRRISPNLTLQMGERRRHLSRKLNAYRIDIVDSGAPIPAGCLEKIFEEYTSYSGGNDRSGGGLGLAICNMLTTQHEGAVWAENRDDGPAFCLVLPLVTKVNKTEDDYTLQNNFSNLEVRE